MQTPCSPPKKPLCGCLTPAQGNRIIESLAWKKSSRISESHRDNRRQSTAAKPAGGAAWALLSGEDGVGKGGPGREAAPAPGTALPGVLAALEQPPNNFPAPPQTFPSAGEAPPPPRAPAEHPPGAAAEPRRGREERSERGREVRAVRSPAGLLPGGSEPLHAPGTVRAGDPRRGDAVSRPPRSGTGLAGGGKRGCRPYLSALVNLRKAWRRSWKER